MEVFAPTPKKILAIKVRSLGDTVLLTAPLVELRKFYPAAKIHVVVSSVWSDVLKSQLFIDRIWSYQKDKNRLIRAISWFCLFLKLRKEKYDLAVVFHASPSTALLAKLLRIPIRAIHFHGHKDENKYSTVVIPNKGKLLPIIERDMDTIRALGITVPAGRLPFIEVENADKFEPVRPLMILGLGASRSAKSWPFHKFSELAVLWVKRMNGQVIAVVSREEKKLAVTFLNKVNEQIIASFNSGEEREACRSHITAEENLTLPEISQRLSNCSVYLGNDSGLKHLAVAIGVPTCTIFGPEHPYEWHPYPKDLHPFFFMEGLNCREDADAGMPKWCGKEVCPQNHECMEQIRAEEVLKECQRIYRK